MITWGDVVEMIAYVFDIKQTQLAETMKCNKSAITRIKQGKCAPSLENDLLFSFVFDPATPNSPANKGGGNSHQYWLDLVKEEIESNFKEIHEAMSDCWDEVDYRSFVLKLLGRARKGASSKEKSSPSADEGEPAAGTDAVIDVLSDSTPSKEDTVSKITSTDQMRQLFSRAKRECHILDFLGENLIPGIDSRLLTWVDRFIQTIRIDILGAFEYEKENQVYIKIKSYSNTLYDYKCYLEKNTRIEAKDVDRLVPRDDDYKEIVSFYLKRLLSLSHEIQLGKYVGGK